MVLLGAGLDARPWRLDLPPGLLWIEVDFAGLLEYKAQLLASEKPRCRLRQIAADLTQTSERQAPAARPGVIITEGLLLYPPARITEAFATEAPRLSGVDHLLLDMASRRLMQNAHPAKLDDVEKLRAPDRMEGQQILDLAFRTGWQTLVRRTYTQEGFAAAAARGLSFAPDIASGDDQTGFSYSAGTR